MNFDFNNVEFQITIDEILSKISEFDIFKKYCSNFIDINKSFCSELRFDKSPDCRIYIANDNKLRYKDFANGDNLDCVNYIMKKFGCNYYEALNIIASDFKIKEIEKINKQLLIGITPNDVKPVNFIKEKSRIEIISQPFNLIDYDYWNQFGIDFNLLDSYNVFSAKYVYLYKGINRWIFEYKKTNPCYAYRFSNQNNYSYKVYWPKHQDRTRKWLFSGGSSNDIEGYDQLNLNGELLILTKSLKDCMCYRVLGYDAISLQGEGNKLHYDLKERLMSRFSNTIVNYDNDEQGIKSTKGLENEFGFKSFFIDKEKDLSDYIKAFGIDKAKRMINKKLKNGI